MAFSELEKSMLDFCRTDDRAGGTTYTYIPYPGETAGTEVEIVSIGKPRFSTPEEDLRQGRFSKGRHPIVASFLRDDLPSLRLQHDRIRDASGQEYILWLKLEEGDLDYTLYCQPSE